MKTPTPRKLPSGSWFVRVTVDGEVYSITEETPELCAAKAMSIKAGIAERKKKKTFPTLEQCVENYIRALEEVLSPSTVKGYEEIKRERFRDYMPENLSKFSGEYCQKMIDSETSKCAPKTLKNAWRLISSAIFRETGTRPVVKLPQVPEPDFKFLDYKQIEVFLEAVHGHKVEIPALLALSSLRRSEIAGLQWENVNLQSGIITVRGSVVYGKDGDLVHKKTNKTRTSTRSVPILIPQLKIALEAVSASSGPVVWQSPETICREINAVCGSAGLPKIGTHGLRHSFASLSQHLGVPEKITMEIGGWSNDATMHRIYTHVARSDLSYYSGKMQSYYEKAARKCNEKCNEAKRA
jgi:integrase